MGTYIVRRLIVAVPTLLGITVLVFFFLTLIPASPFDRPEIAEVDKPFGLDLGLPIAYLGWLADAIQGNFGYATIGGFFALEYVSRGALASATLVGTALALGIVVGIPLGVLSALRPHSKLDVILTTVASFGVSTPTFLLGLVGLWLFGLQLRLVPIGGMQTP